MTPGPRLDHDGPPTPWILYWVGRLMLRLGGWQIDGRACGPKAVVLGVPHTSNWDLWWLLMASWVLRTRLSWIGKHTLFRPPFGWLMRLLGGVPIDRSAPQGLVGQMADTFRARDKLWVCVPPAGTRRFTDHWRSGFYYIAKEAGVPIVMSYLDYGTRRMGLGPTLHPSGDLRADMDQLRAFYADMQGKYPQNKSTIRLRDEDGAPG